MFSKGERVTWRSVFTPVNVSAVLMGVMIVANLRLPSVLDAIVGQAGQVTMPLALMIIGAMLGRSDLLRILRSRELYLISALRLLVVPAVVAYITFRLGWPPMLRMVCIIGAACPAGNLAAVVALQKDTEAAFASEAVVHSTMWSVLTMPVVIWCAGLIP